MTPIICSHCGKLIKNVVNDIDGEKKPHTCPVCGGTGQVPAGFYNVGTSVTGFTTPETCCSCGGSGVLWK